MNTKIQIDYLHDQLWRVVELLQRVNMLADIDREGFNANNTQCNHIKEVIQQMNNGNKQALYEAQALAKEYQGIFSGDENQEEQTECDTQADT